MSKRMVFGVSDWPEELGKQFVICEVLRVKRTKML